MKPSYNAFLSYSHFDVLIAKEVQTALMSAKFSCFMAEMNIKVSHKWEKQVRDALLNSEHVLILITPRSINSTWVLLECGASWILQKKLIPLLMFIKTDALPEPLREYQARIIETNQQIQDFVNDLLKIQPRGRKLGQNLNPYGFTFQTLCSELEFFLMRITQERWIPDIVIGSGRGGIIAAAIIATNLGHKPLKMIDCQFHWVGDNRVTTIDTSSLLSENFQNKKVLIVESTRQSGDTFNLITKEIAKLSPSEIRSFATIWRTNSPSIPDYFAFSLDTIPNEPWNIGFMYSIHDHLF